MSGLERARWPAPPDTSPMAQTTARTRMAAAAAEAEDAYNSLLNSGVDENEARDTAADLASRLSGVWGACFG